MNSVGILGIGVYLPEEIRTNDWWSSSVVAKWMSKRADYAERPIEEAGVTLTPEIREVYAAILEQKKDPFQGFKQRHVAPRGMLSSEMETRAAREALERANVRADEIDFVIVYSSVPDYLTEPNAPTTHHALGLPQRCLSINVEGACDSFLQQLRIARGLVGSGLAKKGLLIQSSNFTSLTPPEAPYSAWFGDGATAVVVGAVSEGRGILGEEHRTDGSMQKLMVAGVPGKRWLDEGQVIWYPHNSAGGFRMLVSVTTLGAQVVTGALAEAKLEPEQVNFYASHQATSWLRRLSQKHSGLVNAKNLDTFESFGSLSAANVPLQLALAEREGMLRPGDVVAAYAGGSGIVWSGLVLCWGT